MNESDFKFNNINNIGIKECDSMSSSNHRDEDIDISNLNITIVGLGLIGGSFAMTLNNLKPKNLWAVDIDMDTINKAKNRNIISEGYVDPTIPLKKSDIVIICVYPNLTSKFIKDNMNSFKSGAIITDTSKNSNRKKYS